MAAPNVYVAHSGSVATVASTLKTILGVNATSTTDFDVMKFKVSADPFSAQIPMLVELVRMSAQGTSSAGTAVRWPNPNNRAANAAPRITYTVEPTRGDILEQFWLTPASPTYEIEYAYGIYPEIAAGAATAVGVSVTPGAGSTPNVRVSLWWIE